MLFNLHDANVLKMEMQTWMVHKAHFDPNCPPPVMLERVVSRSGFLLDKFALGTELYGTSPAAEVPAIVISLPPAA